MITVPDDIFTSESGAKYGCFSKLTPLEQLINVILDTALLLATKGKNDMALDFVFLIMKFLKVMFTPYTLNTVNPYRELIVDPFPSITILLPPNP